MAKIAFSGPRELCAEARAALIATYHDDIGARRIEKGIDAKRLELWRVSIDETESGWLVTERLETELFVWCYVGRQFFLVSRALSVCAIRAGLDSIGWLTFHRAPLRVFKRFSPEVSATGIPGEMRFRIQTERLAI